WHRPDARGPDRRSRTGWSGRGLLGRPGERGQGFKQRRSGRRRRLAIAHLGKHAVDAVQRLEPDVHQLGVDLPLALAQDVEDVFRNVTAGYQSLELQEAGAALDGMKTTENGVEQIAVVGAILQFHQLFR